MTTILPVKSPSLFQPVKSSSGYLTEVMEKIATFLSQSTPSGAG
jgi:hypothetical protein